MPVPFFVPGIQILYRSKSPRTVPIKDIGTVSHSSSPVGSSLCPPWLRRGVRASRTGWFVLAKRFFFLGRFLLHLRNEAIDEKQGTWFKYLRPLAAVDGLYPAKKRILVNQISSTLLAAAEPSRRFRLRRVISIAPRGRGNNDPVIVNKVDLRKTKHRPRREINSCCVMFIYVPCLFH